MVSNQPIGGGYPNIAPNNNQQQQQQQQYPPQQQQMMMGQQPQPGVNGGMPQQPAGQSSYQQHPAPQMMMPANNRNPSSSNGGASDKLATEAFLLGNRIFPFQCGCGKGLYREREIQQHSNCNQFTQKYCQLLQAFVTLKHDAVQQAASSLQSYQTKMSLYTLLTSFRADIKEHLVRENEALEKAGVTKNNQHPVHVNPNLANNQVNPPNLSSMMPQQNPIMAQGSMGAAAAQNMGMMEESKKEDDIDMSQFDTPSCVYCLAPFSEAEQQQNKVQMFLTDGCYHHFHSECFKMYAKKQLLSKQPSGDFGECRCRKCNTIVSAEDLREALGQEFLQNIREQQTKMMMENADGIVQCPGCAEVFSFEPSAPNYAAKDEAGKDVTRETAEHMAKYRVRCSNCAKNFCTNCKKEPYHIGMNCEDAENHRVALKCRYCWEPLTEPSLSPEPCFADVCRLKDCIDKMNASCTKTHACGHKCRGFRGERRCLPCLDKECIKQHNEQFVDFQLYEDYTDEDYCGICMISGIGDEPSIILGCKHIFHVECIKKRVFGHWPSPRITWDFLNCSACKQQIDIQEDHRELHTELTKLLEMKRKVYGMCVERAKYEAIDKSPRLQDPNDCYYNDLQAWSLYKLAYYQCYKCKVPYFGGMKDCIAAQAASQEFKPEELVCAKCSSLALGLGDTNCKKHGLDFIEFKCKFCCSISQWFCWGNTHFCEPCHKRQCAGDYVSRKKVSELPKCPGKENCPLKIAHPANGTEFSLGCALCTNQQANIKNF